MSAQEIGSTVGWYVGAIIRGMIDMLHAFLEPVTAYPYIYVPAAVIGLYFIVKKSK